MPAKTLLALFLCLTAPASAEEWMSDAYKKEFCYLAEQESFTPEKWARLAPDAGEEKLKEVSDKAAARYSGVLASYKALAARWGAKEAQEGLRAINGAKLAEVRLWLGNDGAAYLAAKKEALGGLLAATGSNQPLTQQNLAAADAYLTPELAAQMKEAAKFRAAAAVKPPKAPAKKASFSGADKLKGSPGGSEAGLNSMYDGGGKTGGPAAAAVALKAVKLAPPVKAEVRAPVNTTIGTKSVPTVNGGPDKAAKPIPVDYASMSPEAKRVYQVHAAVVDANKSNSLGPGLMRGTLGNMAGYDRQECNGENDKSIACGYARFLASSAGWYAGKVSRKEEAMKNPGIPTEGIQATRAGLAPGEYMRCYDWANAVNATAENAKLSPQFKKQEVTNPGFLGMGEHHYMVFIGQGKIYISDPWKNGAKLMEVPDTPANRKKWVDR